jgi:hypothetical protein
MRSMNVIGRGWRARCETREGRVFGEYVGI